ncbi:hypothetical protein ACS0TY_029335 [Phlomoides rotata]
MLPYIVFNINFPLINSQVAILTLFFGLLGLSLQCRIIRTTELVTAQEKLHDLERKNGETLKYYSPSLLLHRLQGGHSWSTRYGIWKTLS